MMFDKFVLLCSCSLSWDEFMLICRCLGKGAAIQFFFSYGIYQGHFCYCLALIWLKYFIQFLSGSNTSESIFLNAKIRLCLEPSDLLETLFCSFNVV